MSNPPSVPPFSSEGAGASAAGGPSATGPVVGPGESVDVVVIGAGFGGLAAAISLAAAGRRVRMVETAHLAGGKAGTVLLDGVEVDTGPSVLTLPEVLSEALQVPPEQVKERVRLRALSPGFRYRWPDGARLDVFHHPEETLASVRATFGLTAEAQFANFLQYAGNIWRIAAPHFIYGPPPGIASALAVGFRAIGEMGRLDPWRSMEAAIAARVADPHLRDLLLRYATYNGSDPRRAPATLNCIAHVELAMGGFGVEGGMAALVQALVWRFTELGGELQFGTAVSAIEMNKGAVSAVRLADGSRIATPAVVMNGEAQALLPQDGRPGLLPPNTRTGLPEPAEPSTSGWCGILRAKRGAERVAHEVCFPERYAAEFEDLFDHQRTPRSPTVYLCAQELAHGRRGWAESEPVFTMVNAPAEPRAGERAEDPNAVKAKILERIRSVGLATPDDSFVWWRSPADLARRFPGSRGALYGDASNTPLSAFRRPPNRVEKVPGLFLASGTAHPGGGVPLALRSGLAASAALLAQKSLRGGKDDR